MNLHDLYTTTEQFEKTERMPMLFVGHGSPMNAIEENEFTHGWQEIAASLPKPAAILAISAHWETRGSYVTAMEKPRTIHDFGGFPQELFNEQYPAPGSPALAQEVISAIKDTAVKPDESWGLDHGTWSVLKHFYPDANVPIVQLSLDYHRSPAGHYELAKELASLREKGILIVGSGNIVHNLRMVAWDKLEEPGYGYDWANEVNDKVKRYVLDKDHDALLNYSSQGSAFRMAIPTPEHFMPLLYIAALQNEDEKAEFFNDKAVGGSLTMTSLKIS